MCTLQFMWHDHLTLRGFNVATGIMRFYYIKFVLVGLWSAPSEATANNATHNSVNRPFKWKKIFLEDMSLTHFLLLNLKEE